MTIHSMPNNQKFEDNYDRIFGKGGGEPTYRYMPDLWLTLGVDEDNEFEWHQVDQYIARNSMCLPPNDVYVVKQAHTREGLSFTIHHALGHIEALQGPAVNELLEALEFCSNYGGRNHK